MSDLSRFHEAQRDTFDRALRELQDGAKTSHWMWFIFPQLAGLGSSLMAQRYALANRVEAEAYLRDPVLRARLAEITGVVQRQLEAGVPLPRLMGSEIDARKLVSSLTLFEQATEDDPELRSAAATVLGHAEQQGYSRCAETLRRLSTRTFPPG